MHKLEENIKCETGIAPQSVSGTSVAGGGVSLAKYNNFALACQGAISTAGGTVTFYIAESTDNTTYSTAYLATSVAFAAISTVVQSDVIEVRAEELTDGYTYVRGEYAATQANTYTFVAAENIRFNPRFAAV